MLLQEVFKQGELLLPVNPSPSAEAAGSGTPLVGAIFVVLYVVVTLVLLPAFLHIIPALVDSLFRARGSTSLENSVRQNRDRLLVAVSLLLPADLIMFRYRFYNPSFLEGLSDDMRLLSIMGVFGIYLLVRLIMYLWLMPRRRNDMYKLAHRTAYTYFILLMILILVTAGILTLVGADDSIFRTFIAIEFLVVYVLFLARRAQILSLSCNPLTTFLYLCALEILPTLLFVSSAVFL